MKRLSLLLASCLLGLNAYSQSLDEKVDSLLSRMSLPEKIGQMTQVERGALADHQHLATYGIGSILSGGGSAPSPNSVGAWAAMYDNFQRIALQSPSGIPLIYGIDAVHGHNNLYGAVIFPHNISLGCTWNPELVQTAQQIVAREVSATGIDWTFAPCIAVPRDERWGRTYEGFGETAEVQQLMSGAAVRGLQGNDLSAGETILACAKHFVGDGGTTSGIDQGNTELSEADLRAIHLPGYRDAIATGVGSIMASFNSWNGEKLHGHDYLLTEVLKNELGFEGFVISDWKGVDQVDENYRTAIKRAVNAGIDMVMVPDRYEVFINHLISLVEDNEVPLERIDDAVRRILKQKFLLNLFEAPFTDPSLAAEVGSHYHRSVARQAVRESMVVLQAKNGILPLQKDGRHILVAGALARDLGAQCGGWTISWQGGNGDITIGADILTGLEFIAHSSEINYAPDGDFTGQPDVAVVVVGEKTPYAEGAGDRDNLLLEQEDLDLLKKLKQAGIPTVALLLSGRPMIIGDLLPYTDALIAIWYPGTEGDGVAEVLFGDYQPSGRLTHSWPRDMTQVPVNFGDAGYAPLFPYRHGLQTFPTGTESLSLLPYAAATNDLGDTLLLALTDQVATMDALPADFQITLNGTPQPGFIETVSLAGYDSTLLLLALQTPVSKDDVLSLSYTGMGIQAPDAPLDSLADYPVFNAVSASSTLLAIPGRIEAEDFIAMQGIQTEACSDIGGGLNVGYIEAGDWLKYSVDVRQSGSYQLVGRMAGFAGGTLLLTFNDSLEARINYASTNGWQNWQDFTTTVYLEAGRYTMQTLAQSNAFNINYFDFNLTPTSNTRPAARIQEINVHPNPVREVLSLEFMSRITQNASINLMDPAGKQIQPLFRGRLPAGHNNFTFHLSGHLPAGAYFLEIKDEQDRYFTKILIH